MLVMKWGKGIFTHCWWECKLEQPLWKSIWQFLRKLEMNLKSQLYAPNIPRSTTKTLAQLWSQQLYLQQPGIGNSPDVPQLLNGEMKLWYMQTMRYYSAIKNKDIVKFAGQCMELENIVLSEVIQIQKDTHGIQSLISRHQPQCRITILQSTDSKVIRRAQGRLHESHSEGDKIVIKGRQVGEGVRRGM